MSAVRKKRLKSPSHSHERWHPRSTHPLRVPGRGRHNLHTQCDEIVVHNDLKPNNVLLDNDMMGHISDLYVPQRSLLLFLAL